MCYITVDCWQTYCLDDFIKRRADLFTAGMQRWATDRQLKSQSPTLTHRPVAARGQWVYFWPQADLVGFGWTAEWIWELYFLKYRLRSQTGLMFQYLVGPHDRTNNILKRGGFGLVPGGTGLTNFPLRQEGKSNSNIITLSHWWMSSESLGSSFTTVNRDVWLMLAESLTLVWLNNGLIGWPVSLVIGKTG